MYILQRTDQGGGYVTPSGSKNAYTQDPYHARIFETKEEVERNRCVENEIIIPIKQFHDLLRH
jgi:hypothetical protein